MATDRLDLMNGAAGLRQAAAHRLSQSMRGETERQTGCADGRAKPIGEIAGREGRTGLRRQECHLPGRGACQNGF